MGYFLALAALLRKNVRLFVRDYPSLLIQFAATFIAFLILFLAQLSLDGDASFSPELRADRDPTAAPLPSIPRCIPLAFDTCHTLAYAPADNPDVAAAVAKVAEDASIPDDEVQAYQDSAALNKALLARPNFTQAAYIFEDSDLAALDDGNVRFIVQLNTSGQKDFPIGFTDYHERVVGPAMLHAMNRVLMEERTGAPLRVNYQVSVMPHPDLPGIADAFTEDGPLLLYGIYFLSLVLFLYKIVDEKERGMRDYMRLSGLQQLQHYVSWGVPFLLSFLLTTVLLIAWGHAFRFPFFTRTSFPVYFFTFCIFGFALVGWTFLLETVTRKRSSVSIVAFNAFILSYLLATIGGVIYLKDADGEPVIDSDVVPILQKVFACLPPVMFVKAIQDIAQLAATDFGLALEDVGSYTDLYPVRDCWLWMATSGVIALLVAMYLDNVVSTPTSNGLPPWYLFTPSYWGFGQDSEAIVQRGGKDSHEDGAEAEDDGVDAAATAMGQQMSVSYDASTEDADVAREREAIDSGARDRRPLVIQNLVKRYTTGTCFNRKHLNAVDGMYLSVPRDSVTAILGPNGCGKSTTLRLLSTAISLTSGDVRVYGRSVKTEKPAIRKTLGLCPQYDVYYDSLTAAEHVHLFAALKGMSKTECKEEVDRRLHEVGLSGAADRAAGSFSGGMLRRMSVCLALTGDPAIVALDEASTGTDPISRRDLWAIIEKAKVNRIVLLITHSMEEAEALSDQIAIMGDGKLRVVGTSLHLKNKFGAGYGVTVSTKSRAAAERILSVLEEHSRGTVLEKVSGTDGDRLDSVIAEYALPRHMTDAQMTTVVKLLESRQEELDVARFSVNHTTLDSVFKRIASLSKEKNDEQELPRKKWYQKGCCSGK